MIWPPNPKVSIYFVHPLPRCEDSRYAAEVEV